MSYQEESQDTELKISLSLEGEEGERWRIRISLTPQNDSVFIDGATVVIVDEFGRPLGPAVVLPVAGQLSDTIVLFANVQGPHPMKTGCKLRCTSFYSGGNTQVVEETLSTKCGFGTYVLGEHSLMPMVSEDSEWDSVDEEDKKRIEKAFPWLAPCECGYSTRDLYEQELLDALGEEGKSVTEEILRMLKDD